MCGLKKVSKIGHIDGSAGSAFNNSPRSCISYHFHFLILNENPFLKLPFTGSQLYLGGSLTPGRE